MVAAPGFFRGPHSTWCRGGVTEDGQDLTGGSCRARGEQPGPAVAVQLVTDSLEHRAGRAGRLWTGQRPDGVPPGSATDRTSDRRAGEPLARIRTRTGSTTGDGSGTTGDGCAAADRVGPVSYGRRRAHGYTTRISSGGHDQWIGITSPTPFWLAKHPRPGDLHIIVGRPVMVRTTMFGLSADESLAMIRVSTLKKHGGRPTLRWTS